LDDSVEIVRIEDGFLRSVGLGADLVQPLSWVFDRRGIYYDATRTSDLEYLLQQVDMDAKLLERASQLRARIVASGLTKYNVGSAKWVRPVGASRVILVAGQVESDASLRYGAPGMATNMAVLRTARGAHPDAWLVYKPHPDVVAGLRARGEQEDEASALCDEVVLDAPMGDLLANVDEVHVLTSLAGFEALLRGKRVVCYGQPFYSGWGLTVDLLPNARRTRCLTLDGLVAGALILYPTYIGRAAGSGKATVEQALDELLMWRANDNGSVALWRKGLRPLLKYLERLR
jgi:capsular polysaccharide export protein